MLNRHNILAVDDEKKILDALKRVFLDGATGPILYHINLCKTNNSIIASAFIACPLSSPLFINASASHYQA